MFGLFRLLARLFEPPARPRRGPWPPVRPVPPRPVSKHVHSAAGPAGGAHRHSTASAHVGVLHGKAYVIDGDTIVVQGIRIRISGIDAPELDHPYGKAARSRMIAMCRGQLVTARLLGDVSYERAVAHCSLPDGRDLAAELVKAGLALDWKTFSGGRYRHLEPSDARRRLWRVDAKQGGRIIP